MHRFLIACFVFVVTVSITFGQTPEKNDKAPDPTSPVPKQISGGVLNGKALALPKPPYPAAARAVGASGAVTVQVLIDENGDVVSATAVSGHPLLRAASVEAARGAKFSPTLLEGNPVKVSGVITYNFVGPLYPARLGFALTHAERTASFGRYSMPASLASDLQADWIQEKEILNSLSFETVSAPKQPPAEQKISREPSVAPPPAPSDGNRYTIMRIGSIDSVDVRAGRRLDAKSVVELRNLLTLVEARMSANESSAWSFELGSALGVFVAEIGDETKFASNIARIESLVERAPSSVLASGVQNVKAFLEAAKRPNLTDEERQEIVTKAEMLSNRRY